MSIFFGKTIRNKMPVPIIVDKLSIHCRAINRLIEECVLDREYNTAISLLKSEIETIERKIDNKNYTMTK